MAQDAVAKERANQKRSLETQKKILDAAEELFAEFGFHGTSQRDIHALSGVRVSLSYYHFGSKEAVLQAVVDRRAEEHMQDMLGSLRHSLAMYAHNPLPLDVLIEAYVRPCLERHSCYGAGWKNYIRLLGHLASESASSKNKAQFFKYNSVNQGFIDEFKRSLPNLGEAEIYWGFYFLQTALLNILLDTRIVDSHSGGQCNSGATDQVIEQMQRFFAKGFGDPRYQDL